MSTASQRAAQTISSVRRGLARRISALTEKKSLPTLPTLETLPTLGPDGAVLIPGDGGVAGAAPGGGNSIAEVAAFLYREARLLDERRWDDWLELWQPDATYAMPTRQTTLSADSSHPIGEELSNEGGAWWFDETRDVMAVRIAKLKTGKAWAEEPPSRTRRFVSNVESEVDASGHFTARSNLLVYRGRRDSDVEWFACGRTDLIVRAGSGLHLVSRRVVIDTNVVPADNLILFF